MKTHADGSFTMEAGDVLTSGPYWLTRTEPMIESKAREVLGDRITHMGSLHDQTNYLYWEVGPCVMLDGQFEAEELKAIAWWMENKGVI